ncbi:WD40/YVTN/BNR-like repeat-containing protein [Streptomyces antimicrobicus]|uniref:Oxidoreductase n=1 Tax=Streptomyces antimicrobicus TaxID=2883108 RepID=A0ABS8B879_9ACTN|nr:oxidoreductase [Streptomyces antimicrobicus]MCB5180744.1 oxidoreductase [Streptomyces antimicrobicus]
MRPLGIGTGMGTGMCAAVLAGLLAAAPAARAVQPPDPTGAVAATATETGAAVGTAAGSAAGPAAGTGLTGVGWSLKATGKEARFRGLAAVSRSTAWVSGSKGTVLRTVDGGRTWSDVSPAAAVADGLELRDIEAFDARRAVALSIGEGEDSRVFRTEDGGATWSETFRNPDPKAFYDCLTFSDPRHGLAMSDPVDGKFRILSTDDGGRSWRVLPADGMPAALPGEAGFAASGQCLVSAGPRDVWLATGGGATARVLHSADRGLTWRVAESTVPAGDPAKGVFALAFRHDGYAAHGLAVGGDYRAGEASPRAAAVSADSGRTWQAADTPPPAYRSGVTWLPSHPGLRSAALAVGPTGTDVTTDAGRTWRPLDTGSFDTVSCARPAPGARPYEACWAAGEKGRVARLDTTGAAGN